MKPIDKAIFGTVSESSGRNESERIGGHLCSTIDVPTTSKEVYGTNS